MSASRILRMLAVGFLCGASVVSAQLFAYFTEGHSFAPDIGNIVIAGAQGYWIGSFK